MKHYMKEIGKTKNLMDWVNKLDTVRKTYWDGHYTYRQYIPLKVTKGTKFVKLIDDNSVWGFVCMFDGNYKGEVVKKGDLMKAAGRSAVAKGPRGNIFDGTADFTYQGPAYRI